MLELAVVRTEYRSRRTRIGASAIPDTNCPSKPGSDCFEQDFGTSDSYTVIENTTTGSSFVDSTVSPNTAYLYRVRDLDPMNNAGVYSDPDLATTVIVSDDPLVAQTTTIQARHMEELRTAVNAVRAAGALNAASFTDPSLPGVGVKATHVQELRSNLDKCPLESGPSSAQLYGPRKHGNYHFSRDGASERRQVTPLAVGLFRSVIDAVRQLADYTVTLVVDDFEESVPQKGSR